MDFHATEYYSACTEPNPHGYFHRVIPLHEEPMLDWEDVSKMVPGICRGWYELAQLPVRDRIEFTRDFWLAKLPYHPDLNENVSKFFNSLDDLGLFLTQRSYDDPYTANLVYSLADNSGFFRGECPARESDIIHLQKEFPDFILPPDYLSFLQIHNGFAKLTDTGITTTKKLKESYNNFQSMIVEREEPVITQTGMQVNPKSLLPFYESFGMPFFQCFWKEWYPDQEMGNVYYSFQTRKLSTCEQREECAETLAFQTFTDWLLFYLEKID